MTEREAEPQPSFVLSPESFARLVAIGKRRSRPTAAMKRLMAFALIDAQAARIAGLEAAADKMESEIDNLYRDMAYSRG